MSIDSSLRRSANGDEAEFRYLHVVSSEAASGCTCTTVISLPSSLK
jgi:hypothetical protein